jgi:endonuclease/exonuclease/phosphatase family metal-dependent hydrolase
MFIHYVLLATLCTGVTAFAQPSGPQEASPLRVCSFNIRFGTADDGENRWELRRQSAIDAIRASDPHIVGLQELLAGQRDELAALMGEFEFVAAGRDDGKDKGEMTAILFRKDRFERLDSGHLWLSESGDIGSVGWDAAMTRMASWVLLNDRTQPSKGPILVMNAHLDHVGAESRHQSARLIRRQFEKFPAASVIVMGDFNCTEDDSPYRELAGVDSNRRLIDTYRAVHSRQKDEATYHGFDAGRTLGSRIDWILVSEDFRTLAAAIDRSLPGGRLPSDHFPVTATLTRD